MNAKPAFLLSLLLCSVVSALSVGCTHVQPWERGKLAHPTMTMEGASPAQEHVYAVQEGAVGGSAAAESGCGCN